MTRRLLLSCGVVSSLLYAAMTVFIAMLWEGYSSASQTISELSAIDAPTRPLWVALGSVYALLLVAFGYGVRKSAGPSRPLRVVGVVLIAHGLFALGWPPMHQREVLAAGGGTLTDTLHIVWSMVTVPLMMLAIGFGAAAFGKWFRVYSIATIIFLVGFVGVLTGMNAPNVQANLPTPWLGVWERIGVGVDMLWVAALATMLLRRQDTAAAAPRPSARAA
jgi:uncharacterized protein DUF998